VFTEPLLSNGRFLFFNYSGFQRTRHTIITLIGNALIFTL
jgi:hypothetical protein